MKYYLRHSVLANEEDQNMEFKGHRSFAPEEVNPRNCDSENRPSRQNVAKYACGMLNTVGGGLILLGVLDDGTVEGFMMNQFQRDHFALSVQETFKRFDPPVPEELYSIHFVPVVDHEEEEPEDDTGAVTLQNGDFPHRLFSHVFCWCDHAAFAAFSKGLLNNFYVIEIRVQGQPSKNRQLFKASDGVAYVRRNAMTEQAPGAKDSQT